MQPILTVINHEDNLKTIWFYESEQGSGILFYELKKFFLANFNIEKAYDLLDILKFV